ncbi:TonB-dependent receptor [Sphingobium sp. HWE2-09]|uniref:TonB-dependent receptor n=1 Tax=Sphingobium sp. HWE2-09 TaxID=3108390 RepID=UPI002DCB4428|nr:TonB-dependent receptor [Sphingobium sp. HWE2-09]
MTARKRSETLRDVSASVTAITGTKLRDKNIITLVDLATITSNVQISYGAVQPYTFIRGFGSEANASFEQSVGKFVNNVSFGRDQDGRIPIFDVERVEILRGPQVLTFGNSATVGAINTTTVKPGTRFAADGVAAYEAYNHEIQSQGGLTTPLASWASLRVAGLYQDLAKGRLDNPIKGTHEPSTHNWAVRPSLRLAPADDLEILLYAEIDRVHDKGSAFVPVAQPLGAGTLPYPVAGDRNTRYATYNVAPYFSNEFTRLDAEVYQSDITYRMLGGTLSSTTAWRHSDSDVQFGTDGVDHAQTYFNALWQHYRQFSQELRFSGRYGALDLTAGGYYQRYTLAIDLIQEFTLGGFRRTGVAATPVGRVSNYDQGTRTLSCFVDATYHIVDRLSISGGVRYSDTQKRAGQSARPRRIAILQNYGACHRVRRDLSVNGA